MRSELVERLIGYLRTKPGVTEPEACHIIFDLFTTLFGADVQQNTYLERVEEEIGSKVGSQGTVRLARFVLSHPSDPKDPL